MKNLLKTTFLLHLTVLRVLGLYPFLKYKTVYKIFANFIYIFFVIPLPTFGVLYFCFQEKITLNQICDNFVVFELGCVIFKFIPFIHNGDQIRDCIHMVKSPLFNVYNKNQEKIIEEFSTTCQRIYKFYLSCVLFSVTLWTIKPLVAEDIRLPIDIWVPYVNPTQKFDGLYVFSYIMLVLGCTHNAVANSFIDPLIAGLIYFATCQIMILKDNLLRLSGNGKEDSKVTYKRIKYCIQHYNAILTFVQSIETTFSSAIFWQFLASVLVICISCLQLTMVKPLSMPFLNMVIFIICMLSQVFLYCYFGTILFEEHSTLINAVYMCEWYEVDEKSKRALIILMERSKRPLTVTSGKILDLSLTTFTTILRRAYSLLAVLKNYE